MIPTQNHSYMLHSFRAFQHNIFLPSLLPHTFSDSGAIVYSKQEGSIILVVCKFFPDSRLTASALCLGISTREHCITSRVGEMKFMLSQRPLSQFPKTWGAQCPLSPTNYPIPITRPAFCRKLGTTPTDNTFQQSEYVGQTGRIYTVHQTIRSSPGYQSFLATCVELKNVPFYLYRCLRLFRSDDGQKFHLKYLQPENLKKYQIINDRLKDSASHFRLLKDVIPSESMIVCEPYNTSFYRAIKHRDRLSPSMVKKILKSLLNVLAELHDRDVVYGGISMHSSFCKRGS